MRKFIAIAGVVVALVGGAARPAHASPPVRSGTIVATFYPFAPVLAPGPGPDCRTNADCLPFLVAGCPKALAGRNPSLHSSIVGVRGLAGSSTVRTFTVNAIPRAANLLILGGVAVQFWSQSCSEVAAYGVNRGIQEGGAKFTIPADAVWMTVAAMDSPPLKWTLR